jgi:hypothetical protein
MGQSPFEDWRDKLQKAANWVKNQDTKPQVMNWKPEPNEEQKRQIQRQSAQKKLTPEGPKLGQKKKAAPAKKKAAAKKR